VTRMATDVEASDQSANKLTSQTPAETDWSAAFGFNPAKDNSKSGMDAELDVEEDEDLGFDPFCESQRGLEDLLRGESTGQDLVDPFPGYGRSNSGYHPHSDSGLHKHPSNSSQFPPSLHHSSFLTQNKAHPYSQQHPGLPPPTQKSQTSLLDGLIQQHHDSLEDLLPRSLDVTKKTTSPSHPPGFFSSNQPTSSRFFGSNAAGTASVSHVANQNSGAAKNQQAESFLRSLLFDNPSSSGPAPPGPMGEGRSPLDALQNVRTTPPVGIPPPPPGMGLPHQQQLQQQKSVPPLPFASNASQRLPPGFSSDNLTRQNSDISANALDDFLGRSGWSKMQQQSNRNPHPHLDNHGLSQMQLYQQQSQQRHPQQQQPQQQQSYSKMMGLMNLGSASKVDELEGSTPFPSTSSTATTPLSAGAGTGFPRSGFPFGSSTQQQASTSTSVKDWQEGFRALLPNVNISFGQNANQAVAGSSSSGSTGISSNLPPWDDPAIVTAANASKHFNNNNNNNSPLRGNHEARSNQDEQPHWMKSLQQLTEMTESAPPKQAQGSSPSAFLPTLAGVNQSSLLSGPFGVNNAQQQQQQHHHQQQQQLMQNALLGNRGQTERLFHMGGNGVDWTQSYSSGFSGPSLTSAPPGFRLPNANAGQPAPAGATN